MQPVEPAVTARLAQVDGAFWLEESCSKTAIVKTLKQIEALDGGEESFNLRLLLTLIIVLWCCPSTQWTRKKMDAVTRALMNEYAQASGISDLADDKKFEHFSAYSIVSSKYSDEFDASELVVGDGADLNVDAFAVKVNGRIADDPEFVDDVLKLNGYLDVEFIVIQAKTSSNFDGAALIALGDNLRNQVFSESQTVPVNPEVKRLIRIKERILDNAAKLKENPTLSVYYACTGNWNEDTYLVEAIKTKRRELEQTNIFSSVDFSALGAKEIQKMFRDTRTSISREVKIERLVTIPTISNVNASYLGILPQEEFFRLITDESGELVKTVFVDNVRDFQGENPVNADIAKTISDGALDQFVLRNNGVTVVAKKINVTSSSYRLEDYQIVNGCQTSHVLYANRHLITGDLYVPVKIIHTEDDDVSQSIIRSTNKQTPVEENDLLALTQFQRDLEDYYKGFPEETRLYYERRAKQYSSQSELEKGRITSVGSQLKSFSSMFLELPNQASRYQGTLLRSVKNQVFQANHKPDCYFLAALAQYRFEVLARRLPVAERSIKSFRYYLLLAFRYRYETFPFPGAGNKKVSAYCAPLLGNLESIEKSKDAFDECSGIVKAALVNQELPLERDSAKSRPLIQGVIDVAIRNNSSKSSATPT